MNKKNHAKAKSLLKMAFAASFKWLAIAAPVITGDSGRQEWIIN